MAFGSMQINGTYQICTSAHGIMRSTTHGTSLMALNLQIKQGQSIYCTSSELLGIKVPFLFIKFSLHLIPINTKPTMKLLIPILLLSAIIAQAKPIATKASPPTITYQKLKHPEKAMTNEQAKAILKEMQQQRNDEEKIAVIKAKLNDKEVGIPVNQLVTLLNQFLTDDSKLAAAKYAFEYTTNYKSYLDMINLFSREEYKDALEDFYKKNK
jgi:hypothetical protein